MIDMTIDDKGRFAAGEYEPEGRGGRSRLTEKETWRLLNNDIDNNPRLSPPEMRGEEATRLLMEAHHYEELSHEAERAGDERLARIHARVAAAKRAHVVAGHARSLRHLVVRFFNKRRDASDLAHPNACNGPADKVAKTLHSDAFQFCAEVALHAATRWTGENGASFNTYLLGTCESALRDWYREEASLLSGMSTRQIRVSAAIGRLKMRYYDENGRYPSRGELLAYVNDHVDELPFKQPVTVETFQDLEGYTATSPIESTHEADNGDEWWSEEVTEEQHSSNFPSPEEALSDEQEKKSTRATFYGVLREALTGRQFEIIAMRFGLRDGEPMGTVQIAKVLGISPAAVSLAEKRAKEILRDQPGLLAMYVGGLFDKDGVSADMLEKELARQTQLKQHYDAKWADSRARYMKAEEKYQRSYED